MIEQYSLSEDLVNRINRKLSKCKIKKMKKKHKLGRTTAQDEQFDISTVKELFTVLFSDLKKIVEDFLNNEKDRLQFLS